MLPPLCLSVLVSELTTPIKGPGPYERYSPGQRADEEGEDKWLGSLGIGHEYSIIPTSTPYPYRGSSIRIYSSLILRPKVKVLAGLTLFYIPLLAPGGSQQAVALLGLLCYIYIVLYCIIDLITCMWVSQDWCPWRPEAASQAELKLQGL